MGTSKPLTIWVHPSLEGASWIDELRAKGHIVYSGTVYSEKDDSALSPPWSADLILGPNCARFVPGMEKFLDAFLKGARKAKYPEKKDV